MSFRSRSTIIKFSDRDFSSLRSQSVSLASSVAESPRAQVPLMGFDQTVRSGSTRRNLSGDELRIARSPKRTYAACGAGLSARNAL